MRINFQALICLHSGEESAAVFGQAVAPRNSLLICMIALFFVLLVMSLRPLVVSVIDAFSSGKRALYDGVLGTFAMVGIVISPCTLSISTGLAHVLVTPLFRTA